MAAQTLVKLNDVRKAYTKGKESVEVLHSINLEIPEGDFIALMGPSGSGKTTLLNMLGGLDKPPPPQAHGDRDTRGSLPQRSSLRRIGILWLVLRG